ncbi:hypothetical protein Sjap_016000 [Stephania japonica]|uniref:Uncharacterized protein n=1 Tax=Stephania japonica TaxID=461633 RepID=A0AAP0NRX5_9MAGN
MKKVDTVIRKSCVLELEGVDRKEMSSSAPFVALSASVGEPPTRVDHKEYSTKSKDSGMEVDLGSYRDRLLTEKRYKFVENMVPKVGDIRIDRDENGPFMVISNKLI